MSSKVSMEKNEYPKATGALVVGAVMSYIGFLFLMMCFCSPYWISSYEESFSSFKNMGLWEYCFKDFRYPYYQFTTTFNGCHNIFSREYYVIREWLLPGWLMIVQSCVTLSFLLTLAALVIMALELIRWPLKFVLQYEWVLTRISFYCISVSSLLLFLASAIFGGNAYRRDWLMYPRFNELSWAYALCVVAFMILGMAALILWIEARRAYEERREAKNLVMQMQEQEPGYQPGFQSGFQTPAGRSIQDYI